MQVKENKCILVGSENIKPVLQYRWKLEESRQMSCLNYYGIRNYPLNRRQKIFIKNETASLIAHFDGKKNLSYIISKKSGSENALEELKKLIKENIIVDIEFIKTPSTLKNYQTCIKCVNNDYVIPGLEFDDRGVCAACQCYENIDTTESNPLTGGGTITEEELLSKTRNNKSKFDVLVLYTGGKDSSYLLWYLAKKLKLRVLACTWDMPFMSKTSEKNMQKAYEKLPEVEFVRRKLRWDETQNALRSLTCQFAAPCVCPFIAYALFFPLAVQEKIPFIMDGIEAVQAAIFEVTRQEDGNSEKKISLSDREQSLAHIKNLVIQNKKPEGYLASFLDSTKKLMTPVFGPLKTIVEDVDKYELPSIKRLKSEKVYGTWDDVKTLIEKELDWEAPPNQKGLLHTSCDIEKAKDFICYQNFTLMRSEFLPQSIMEISCAVYFGLISREKGLEELAEAGYYGRPDAFNLMMKKLNLKDKDITNKNWHLYHVLQNCNSSCTCI